MAAEHFLLAIVDESLKSKIESYDLSCFALKQRKPEPALFHNFESGLQITVNIIRMLVGKVILLYHGPKASQFIERLRQEFPEKVDASEIVLTKQSTVS